VSDYKGHIAGGLLATTVLTLCFYFLNWKQFGLSGMPLPYFNINILLFIGISLIYSQLPDIDTPASKIRMFFTLGLSMAAFILLGLGNRTLAMASMGLVIIIWTLGFIKGFGHRGITHTWWFGYIMCIPLYFGFNSEAVLVGYLNYIIHLVMDRKD
jgi:hypothetical protein